MVLMLVAVMSATCSDGDVDRAFETEYAEVVAERDALAAQIAESAARYERSTATIEATEAILHDPKAYGTEEELADSRGEFAVEGAVMDDDVFGSVAFRDGFLNTLYGGTVDPDIDTEIEIFDKWLSADGSQGGSLWVWRGTNAESNPFELVGSKLTDYDENGMITYQFVSYPYSDEYVWDAVFGEGTLVVTQPSG